MSASVTAPRPPLVRGVVAVLRGVVEAVGSLDRREWAIAIAAGLVFGMTETLRGFAPHGNVLPTWRLDLALRIAATTMVELVLACALLAVGLRWLDRRSGGRPALAGQAALVCVVSLLAAAMCAEPLREAIFALHVSLGLEPGTGSPIGPSYSENVMHLAFALAMYLSLWALVYRYFQRGRRSAEQLAAAQARGIDAERRVLAEQLAGAQAMVEPAFLFDTLQLADRLLEHDEMHRKMRSSGLHAPPFAESRLDIDRRAAHRVLDELHRYLRAALPPADGSVSTLGQQTELLRARLAIEAIRLDGRLVARIEAPAALAAHPLPPMLLLPLATNAVRHGIEPAGGGEIVVRASEERGRLCIEVADSGPGRAATIRDGAGLGALRERLAALYGEHASLMFADRKPCGVTARVEIDPERTT
jgi:signal transduction histidine kinase